MWIVSDMCIIPIRWKRLGEGLVSSTVCLWLVFGQGYKLLAK